MFKLKSSPSPTSGEASFLSTSISISTSSSVETSMDSSWGGIDILNFLVINHIQTFGRESTTTFLINLNNQKYLFLGFQQVLMFFPEIF